MKPGQIMISLDEPHPLTCSHQMPEALIFNGKVSGLPSFLSSVFSKTYPARTEANRDLIMSWNMGINLSRNHSRFVGLSKVMLQPPFIGFVNGRALRE